jgi:hypothetical protein
MVPKTRALFVVVFTTPLFDDSPVFIPFYDSKYVHTIVVALHFIIYVTQNMIS